MFICGRYLFPHSTISLRSHAIDIHWEDILGDLFRKYDDVATWYAVQDFGSCDDAIVGLSGGMVENS